MLKIILLVLVLLPVSCTIPPPQQIQYLRTAVDHATQDEVAQRLGAPSHTVALTDGGSVWTYRYPAIPAGTTAATTTPAASMSSCDELILTFDSQHVLRKWLRQSCTL